MYDADAATIALALDSITDLFVMSHSLETQIAATRLTPTSVDFDALMNAAPEEEDPDLDGDDPMEEVEIFD